MAGSCPAGSSLALAGRTLDGACASAAALSIAAIELPTGECRRTSSAVTGSPLPALHAGQSFWWPLVGFYVLSHGRPALGRVAGPALPLPAPPLAAAPPPPPPPP